MTRQQMGLAAEVAGGVMARAGVSEQMGVGSIWSVTCRDAEGRVKWIEAGHNIVTTLGANLLLDAMFRAQAAGSWFVGLKGAGAVANADTMASHAAWAEVTAYSQASRPAWTANGAAAAAALSNSAAKASFSINANGTAIAGAFLANNSTKGGTTGVLFCVFDFSASRTLASGDTLEVQVDLSVTI